MKKVLFNRKIILIVLLTIILIMIFYKSIFPVVWGKLYSGNHIRINVAICYEGKKINIDKVKIRCVNPENQNEEINQKDSRYSFKGGKYGKYTVVLTIPGDCLDIGEEDIIIELQYLNSNDWYISDTNCIIDIKKLDDVMKCNCEITTKYNDGTYTDYSKEKKIEDGTVNFSWGI